jgi:hypothetical protein
MKKACATFRKQKSNADNMKERFESLVEHLIENGFFLEEAVEILEKTLIQRALAVRGNRSAASKLLGYTGIRCSARWSNTNWESPRPPQPARRVQSARKRAIAG